MNRLEIADGCRTAADVWAQVKRSAAFRARMMRAAAPEPAAPEPKAPEPKSPEPKPAEQRLTHADIVAAAAKWIAQRQLAIYPMQTPPREPRIETIQLAVIRHYEHVSHLDLLSVRRTNDVVRPRMVGMYLARTMTTKSLPEIGRRFGGRDHTTVLHALRKIGMLIAIDAELAEKVAAIKETIELAMAA